MNDQENPTPTPAPAPQAQPAENPDATPDNAVKKRALREAVVKVLKTVYDPEIPVNIYEMGLVYSIDVSAEGFVHIRMTLTAPTCPVAESLPVEVEAKVRSVHEVTDVRVELVWEPAWTMNMMSESARLTLNL